MKAIAILALAGLVVGCNGNPGNGEQTMDPCPADPDGGMIACSDGPNDLAYTEILSRETVVTTSSAGQCSAVVVLHSGNYTFAGYKHYGQANEEIPCAFDAKVDPCKVRRYYCQN